MTPSNDRQDLVHHLQWADAAVWATVLSGEPPLDPKVKDWLHHIHLVQNAFLHIWRGQPVAMSEPSDFPDGQTLARWGRDVHGRLIAFVDSAEEAEFDRELEIPWTEELTKKYNRPISAITLGQSILQVAMHSTHHRAQVCTRLRELGTDPPMVDFIVWMWISKPAPEWPELG